MDAARQRAIKVLVGLTALAHDQKGRPEGANALSKAQAIIAKYAVTDREVDPRTYAFCGLLGLSLQMSFTPPRRDNYGGGIHVKPRRATFYTGSGPYEHSGTCPACARHFVRRSEHQGHPPTFCSDECHGADRNRKARERMARNRAKKAQDGA